MILAFEIANSKLDVCSVADVDNSLVEIRSLSLVEVLDPTLG